jgi:hypothetical protein
MSAVKVKEYIAHGLDLNGLIDDHEHEVRPVSQSEAVKAIETRYPGGVTGAELHVRAEAILAKAGKASDYSRDEYVAALAQAQAELDGEAAA